MFFIFGVTTAIQIIISIVIIFVVFIQPTFSKADKSILCFLLIWIGCVYVSFFIINVYLIGEKKTKTNIVFWRKAFISMVVRKWSHGHSCSKELDGQISSDKLLKTCPKALILHLKSTNTSTKIIWGFWNKYEMRLSVAYRNSSLSGQTLIYRERNHKNKNTHFYSVPSSWTWCRI